MKVLVIGATGKTGHLVVERAVMAGHKVVALVHTAEEERKHPFPTGVEAIHGDVENPSRLEHAMEGCQAVIDALGGKSPITSTGLESAAARVILEVMDRVRARRLIVISGLGVGESKAEASFFYEHILMPTLLHGVQKEKVALEAEGRHSHVEWVIVRPALLKDGDSMGPAKVVEPGDTAHSITRFDLAQFLVDQLTSDAYLGQAVTVANS